MDEASKFSIKEDIDKFFKKANIKIKETNESEGKGKIKDIEFSYIIKYEHSNPSKLSRLLKENKNTIIFTEFNKNLDYFIDYKNKNLAVNTGCFEKILNSNTEDIEYEFLSMFTDYEEFVKNLKKDKSYIKSKEEVVKFINSLDKKTSEISHDYKMFVCISNVDEHPNQRKMTIFAILIFLIGSLVMFYFLFPKAPLLSIILIIINIISSGCLLMFYYKSWRNMDKYLIEDSIQKLVINSIHNNIMEASFENNYLKKLLGDDKIIVGEKYKEIYKKAEDSLPPNQEVNVGYVINLFFNELPLVLKDKIKLDHLNIFYNTLVNETFVEYYKKYFKEYGTPKIKDHRILLPHLEHSIKNPYYLSFNIIFQALVVISAAFLMVLLTRT